MDNSNFVRANSSNLPKVDTIMLLEFFKNSDKHNVAEIRGVKALMSSRESYVENAVGYVEVKRTGILCDVRAKVVPEHKVSLRHYMVTVQIEEKDDTILDASCDGCAAAAGGCKHTLVLLYWLQTRSSEPSPTSIQCYWQKPGLSHARNEVVLTKQIYKSNISMAVPPKDPSMLDKFRAEATKQGCSKALLNIYDPNNKADRLTKYCVFDIMVDFVIYETNHTFENFKLYSSGKVENCEEKIRKETVGQCNSKLWHCLRQGRITGSKMYEIAHYKTTDGSLVEQLLGGYKMPETKAMKRGKVLEKKIIEKLKKELNENIEDAGFFLINGIFGASPDGIANDFVIEIKCPISEKSKQSYIKNKIVSNKCMGQIQLEILATQKSKCLFCVADPNFEQNQRIEKVIVDFDEVYIKNMMDEAEKYWKTYIYPRILKSAL